MTDLKGTGTGPGVLCKVCGDRASGKHYGVPSCDGCRGFFKRSIRRNLEYVCKEGGRCIVDVSRRNQCQACRFSKCLQANMRREAVQHERAPRSCSAQSNIPIAGVPLDIYSSRRLSMSSSGLFMPFPMHIPTNSSLVNFPTLEPPRYFPTIQTTGFIDSVFTSPHNTPRMNKVSVLSENIFGNILTAGPAMFKDSTILPSCSVAKEDEVTSSEEIPSTSVSSLSVRYSLQKEAIFESAAKLLFLAVKWAKSVPSFAQLPARDQTILLQDSWAELFVITSSQWGLPVDSSILENGEEVSKFQKAINQFAASRIDHTEAACLKALILFKPECSGLISRHQIASLQDQTLNLLHEKCGPVRLGHLLLILPTIKSAADPNVLQEMFFKKTIGDVAVERLLGDLMKT